MLRYHLWTELHSVSAVTNTGVDLHDGHEVIGHLWATHSRTFNQYMTSVTILDN